MMLVGIETNYGFSPFWEQMILYIFSALICIHNTNLIPFIQMDVFSLRPNNKKLGTLEITELVTKPIR